MLHNFCRWSVTAAFILGFGSCFAPVWSADAEPVGHRFALLVGCTTYDNIRDRSLEGPVNDVLLFKDLLEDPHFGFRDGDIRLLAEQADIDKAEHYASEPSALTPDSGQ